MGTYFMMAENMSELDFTSISFNAIRALYTTNLQPPVPNAHIFNNINEYTKSLKAGRNEQKPSEEGDLAIRLKNIAENNVSKLRNRKRDPRKLEHLMKMKSQTDGIVEKVAMLEKTKKKGRQMNVLERMEEKYKEGPLSILYNCIEKKAKLKVWTRKLKGLRGVCVGYLIAFDKHMNLAMMDVDEMFAIEEELEVDPSESMRRIEKKKEKKRKWRRRKREKSRQNEEHTTIFSEEVRNIESERNDSDNIASGCCELNMSTDTGFNFLRDDVSVDGNLDHQPTENNIQSDTRKCLESEQRNNLDNGGSTMETKRRECESSVDTENSGKISLRDDGFRESLDCQPEEGNIQSGKTSDIDNEIIRDEIQENQSHTMNVKVNECSKMELCGTDIRRDNANSAVSIKDIVQSNHENMEQKLIIEQVNKDAQRMELSESDLTEDLLDSEAGGDVSQSNDSVEGNLYIHSIDPELDLERQSGYSDEINNFDSGSDNRETGELALLREVNIDDRCKQKDGLNTDSINASAVACESNKKVELLNNEVTICDIMKEVKRTESELDEAVTMLVSDKNTKKYLDRPYSALRGNVLEQDEESQDSVIFERTDDRENLFVETVTLHHKITYGVEETFGGTKQDCQDGSSWASVGDTTNQPGGGYCDVGSDTSAHGKSTDDSGGTYDGDQLDGGHGNDDGDYDGNDDSVSPGHEVDNGSISDVGNGNGSGEDRSNDIKDGNDNDGNGAKFINEGSNEKIIYEVINEGKVINEEEEIDETEVIDEEEIIDEGEVIDEEEVIDKIFNEEEVIHEGKVMNEEINEAEVIDEEEVIDEVIDEKKAIKEEKVIGEVINEEKVIDEIMNEEEVIDEVINEEKVINEEEVIDEGEVMDEEKIIDEGEVIDEEVIIEKKVINEEVIDKAKVIDEKEEFDEEDKPNDKNEKQSVTRNEKVSKNPNELCKSGDMKEITAEERNVEEKEEGELSSSSGEEYLDCSVGEKVTSVGFSGTNSSKSNSIEKRSSTSNLAKDKSKKSEYKDMKHKAQMEEVSVVKSHEKKSNIGLASAGKERTTSKKAQRVDDKELSRRRHSISCTGETRKTDKSAEKSGQRLVKERRRSLIERGEKNDDRSSRKVEIFKTTENRRQSLRKAGAEKTTESRKISLSKERKSENTKSSEKKRSSSVNQIPNTSSSGKDTRSKASLTKSKSTMTRQDKHVDGETSTSSLNKVKRTANDRTTRETKDASCEKQRKQKAEGSDDKYSESKESTRRNSSNEVKHTASDSRLKKTERETKASETKSSKVTNTCISAMKFKPDSSSESSTKHLSNKQPVEERRKVDKIRSEESGNIVRSSPRIKSSKLKNISNSAMQPKRGSSSSESSSKYLSKSNDGKRYKVTTSSASFVKSKLGDSSGSESVTKHSLKNRKELMKPNEIRDTRKEKLVTPIKKDPDVSSKGKSRRSVGEKSSASKNVTRKSDVPIKTESENVSGKKKSNSQENSKKKVSKIKEKTDPKTTKPEKKPALVQREDSGSKSRDKPSVRQNSSSSKADKSCRLGKTEGQKGSTSKEDSLKKNTKGKVLAKNDAQNSCKEGSKIETLKKEQSLSKNAQNECKNERGAESSNSAKERRFSNDEKPREIKKQKGLKSENDKTLGGNTRKSIDGKGKVDKECKDNEITKDKTIAGNTRKSIDGKGKVDKECKDNKITKDKTLESNKRKVILDKDLEVKEKITFKNDENTSKEPVLKKLDNKCKDERKVESLKKNSAKERSISSDDKPRDEKKVKSSKSENDKTPAGKTKKSIKVASKVNEESSRKNKNSQPSEGSQNKNNSVKQKDGTKTLNASQSSIAQKVRAKTATGKRTVGDRKLIVAECKRRKENETCKPTKNKPDQLLQPTASKKSENLQKSQEQSEQNHKGGRLSGKRKREDTLLRPRKVRKTADTNKENVKTKEAKLPGNVLTVRILKVDKRRGKALVLKRRHVNQLFIRGDNIIMVAYENVASSEIKL